MWDSEVDRLSSNDKSQIWVPKTKALGYLCLHELDHNYIHKLHPPIEVSSDKLLDTGLAGGVQVLKLMHGWELLHIQTIRGHHIWIINISIKTVNGQLDG